MSDKRISSQCSFRDMLGVLIAVKEKPKILPEVGSIYRLDDKLYVVGGMAFVNYRLNINLQQVERNDSKRADTPKH